MKRKHLILFGIAVCVSALVAPAQVARADLVQTVSQMIGLTPTNSPPTFLTVPQFNPATGTLLFVVVRISATFNESIMAENLAPTAGHVAVAATQTVTVTPPAFVAPFPAQGTANIPLSNSPVAAFDGTFDFAGPSSAAFTLTPNPLTQQIANLTINSNLSNFIGVGNLPGFQFQTTGNFQASSDTGLTAFLGALMGGTTLEVEYHYVPEPASLLMLAGAGSILIVRRRRRR